MSDVSRALHIQGEAAKVLLANIRDVIGDDDEMIATAVEGETSLVEAISSAVDRLAEVGAHCEVLAARIKDLSERKGRFEDQASRIKAAIHVAMGHGELRKLELPQATISIRAVQPKVEVIDETEIPARFWKRKDPELDRKELLKALNAKEVIPGATLSNGGETISIRSK